MLGGLVYLFDCHWTKKMSNCIKFVALFCHVETLDTTGVHLKNAAAKN